MDGERPWFFTFGKSAGIVALLLWPAKEFAFDGVCKFLPDTDGKPCWAIVQDPNEWEGFRFVWRGPLYTYAACGVFSKMCVIGAGWVGDVAPLLQVLARSEFARLPKVAVAVLAKELGLSSLVWLDLVGVLQNR